MHKDNLKKVEIWYKIYSACVTDNCNCYNHHLSSGSVRGVARIIFNTEIEVSLLNYSVDIANEITTTKEHYVFLIHILAYNLPPLGKMGYISEKV